MTRNAIIYSVSEIAQNVKNTIENTYGYVHVRGELTEVKRAASGHIYATLKDAGAVLNVIVWKSGADRLKARPEDGLEVIATGRMTTYPGRSNYQLVIEQMEVAGAGALLKLIEERRQKLAAEGLFDESRKRALPPYPAKIAVVTSPTGAVIRDILHRLAERWPCHVYLWPVLVQGEGAAQQITAALKSFCAMAKEDLPDLVILARGGGSLEDLMAFNDEALVRAAAACPVPLISAVGHETDTTLVDWAADRRAPTPTAAAEMATPHRANLLADLAQARIQMGRCLSRVFETHSQRVDQAGFRLGRLVQQKLDTARTKLSGLRPRSPGQILQHQADRITQLGKGLNISITRYLEREMKALSLFPLDALIRQKIERYTVQLAGLKPRSPALLLAHQAQKMASLSASLERAIQKRLSDETQRLNSMSRLLKTVSFEATLERGFALVLDDKGVPVTQSDALQKSDRVELQFAGSRKKSAEIL